MLFELLLGHLIGDYLLQTSFMANNKSKNNLIGYVAAIFHCLVYSIVVVFIMSIVNDNAANIYWFIILFFSHFFIDKYSLAMYWMKYIKNYTFTDYYKKSEITPEGIIKGGFITFVYILTDNTMHLVLMWVAYLLFF